MLFQMFLLVNLPSASLDAIGFDENLNAVTAPVRVSVLLQGHPRRLRLLYRLSKSVQAHLRLTLLLPCYKIKSLIIFDNAPRLTQNFLCLLFSLLGDDRGEVAVKF